VPDGTIVFEGNGMWVPVNWSDGTAIHGLAASAPWRIDAAQDLEVALSIDIEVDRYQVLGRQAFALTADALEQRLEVVNLAPWRVPVGLGIHPWFAVDEVRVPAALAWPGDGPLPGGPPRPVDERDDLRTRRVAPPMDRCYTGLTGDSAEIGDVTLSWSGPISQVVVFSGMPEWVCVEPVTMANNGFQLAVDGVEGHGVIALDPGESVSVGYRFAWG
jgi:aldose 1-epimerase